MTPSLDPAAHAAATEYLAALDKALPPDRVHGVYLTGSAVLDDWRPGRSDLDLLTVTSGVLSDGELDALGELHAALVGKPHRDAVYVTVEALGTQSADTFPHTVDGEFHSAGHEVDPVLWATLHRHGHTLRGPAAADLGAAPDQGWLREWNVGNLRSYWLANATDLRLRLAARAPESPVPTEYAVWDLLGPGRLHCTVATGKIISKTASAAYTARLFPAYSDLLDRALAWRLGDDSVAFTAADVVQVCDLVVAVVHDATTPRVP